jgi:2-succinyl-5-enolpyruvyl-6-hydroxy-3-cyclohexene-1-carboxylate synthase
MNYWGWVIGYLAISMMNLYSAYIAQNAGMTSATAVAGAVYIMAFFTWPLFVTDEHREEMKRTAQKYKDEEKMSDEAREQRMKEWMVVKVYSDHEDSLTFSRDREVLEKNSIASLAKSGLGVTTLAIHISQVEIACKLLNVDAAEIDSHNE